MAKAPLPSPELLRQLLEYDPEAGLLKWRARPLSMFSGERHMNRWNTCFAGRPAFACKDRNGYCRGSIFNKPLKAHRIAWAIHYGEWPSDQIDHINGNRADNRITNLRVVTNLDNQKNTKRRRDNTSGHTGVIWYKSRAKWMASIKHNGRKVSLGYFSEFIDAVSARKAAEKRFGYHPNHGRVQIDSR